MENTRDSPLCFFSLSICYFEYTTNSPAVRYGIAREFFGINIFNYAYIGLAHINNGVILCVDDIILMQIEITAVIYIYWLWRLIDIYNVPHN